MDADRLLRAARRQAGLSQRALAARAGVPPSVVAEIESGRRSPRWQLVQELLRCADLDVQLCLPSAPLQETDRAWLALSTSARLYWALGGRRHHRQDRTHPSWCALGAVAAGRCVVLDPALSTAVWLREHPAPPRTVVRTPTALDVWGRALTRVEAVDVVMGPVSTAGTVPVGVTARAVVLVHTPDAPLLQTDPVTSARLRGVAEVLHLEKGRDEQGRRGAAHRDASLDDPDPRESRHWRLGGEASFRAWLARRRFEL